MFNPEARWDRSLPIQDSNYLDEGIEALVLFKRGKVIPRYFIWRDRRYKIKKINYNWQERRGRALIHFFSVDTGANIYQISFNSQAFGWRIDKIID